MLHEEFGPTALVIGKQDSVHLEILAGKLESLGCSVVRAGGVFDWVVPLMQFSHIRLVFCDLELEEGCYADLVEALRIMGSPTKLIVTSRLSSMREYIEAIQVGAYDFLCPPFDGSELSRILHYAVVPAPAHSERWTVGAA